MRRYNPKEIEAKWQDVWSKTELYATDEDEAKEKYYCLVMFPYPSGNLHVGHWYNFGPADVVARYHRMLGKRVLHPIGFDAFGLPAENAAIKRGIAPAEWTWSNIDTMTAQLRTIGTMYDWSKTINTAKPDYYRWTQWLFLTLFNNGLAERKKGLVNWCPKDMTVLANEQVVGENNECERCGTPVVQKDLEQWYFKTTEYADQLLDDAEELDWPERVKTMQANWIGRSHGMVFTSPVKDTEMKIQTFSAHFEAFRADTFVVIAPDHPLLPRLVEGIENKQEILDKAQEIVNKRNIGKYQSEDDIEGIFTGRYTVDPVGNGELPIWVASFALANYGTGIVKCSAHDERDFRFAKKYGINLKPVLFPRDEAEAKKVQDLEYCYSDMQEGVLTEPEEFAGKVSGANRDAIIAYLEKNNLAKKKTSYRLRDWLISRQRYWGAPIPIIYCDDCGTVPVPEDQLPVVLPEDVEFEPTGQSPLLKIDEFVNTTCPKCSKPANRETDTMDTFVDSSWYYLRYPKNNYEDGPFDPDAVKKWLPVDHYIGGVEHAILHLLYARFITKALHDHAGLPFNEPFKKLSNQGIILGPDGQKMSKSKGNVVDPDDQVASYGADSLRLYLMFMGPYNQGGPYDFGGIAGSRRFLDRVWNLVMEFQTERESGRATEPKNQSGEIETQLVAATHKTLQKVTRDLDSLSFNTAIAAMMELINTMTKLRADLSFVNAQEVWHEQIEILVRMLAPFAPHLCEELWHELGNDESVHIQAWPTWNADLIKQDLVTIVIQVSGKVRGTVVAAPEASKDELVALAKAEPNVMRHLEDKKIAQVVHVPGRLINFVVAA